MFESTNGSHGVIDLNLAKTANGSNIGICGINNTDTQKWRVVMHFD